MRATDFLEGKTSVSSFLEEGKISVSDFLEREEPSKYFVGLRGPITYKQMAKSIPSFESIRQERYTEEEWRIAEEQGIPIEFLRKPPQTFAQQIAGLSQPQEALKVALGGIPIGKLPPVIEAIRTARRAKAIEEVIPVAERFRSIPLKLEPGLETTRIPIEPITRYRTFGIEETPRIVEPQYESERGIPIFRIRREGRPEEGTPAILGATKRPYQEPAQIISVPGREVSTGIQSIERWIRPPVEKPGFLKTAEEIFREKRREYGGYVNMDTLRHVTFGGIGATTGATIDEENRWRGAVIGGSAGLVISSSMASKVLGRKPFTAPDPLKPRIERPIEVKPLLEPIFREDIDKAIVKSGEELLQLANIQRDPTRLISDQLTDALKRISGSQFRGILQKNGVAVDQFIESSFPEVAPLFRESISSAARRMAYRSQLVQRLKAEPGMGYLIDSLKDVSKEIQASDVALSWWRRADNIRRGLLVTQLATSMRNAETQAARVGMDIFEKGLDAGLQRLFGRTPTVHPLDGFNTVFRVFQRGNRKTVDRILKEEWPHEWDRMFSIYSSDIAKRTKGTGNLADKIFSRAEDVVDFFNTFNRGQEFLFRRSVFLGDLSQRLRTKGLNLESIITNNEMGKIPIEDIRGSVNKAMEYTFAKAPNYGTMGRAFVDAINKIPGLSFVLPFPRFLVNSLKFNFDYSPLGILRLLSPAQRTAFANADTKIISRATMGSGMLGAAYLIRNSEYAGDKWYEIKVGEKTWDTRPYNPFGAYFFAADLYKRWKDGTLHTLTSQDLTMGVLSQNLRAGVGLYTLDKFLNWVVGDGDEKKALQRIKEFGGEAIAGLATPAQIIKDFYDGFGIVAQRERRTEPILGPTLARIPGAEERGEPMYIPTQERPLEREGPALRQMTGISLKTKNILQSELDRLGFRPIEVFKSTGDPKADNLIRKNMGMITENFFMPVIASPDYRTMSNAEKENFLNEALKEIRKDARELAETQAPELFMQLKISKIPEREKRLMKSYGIQIER